MPLTAWKHTEGYRHRDRKKYLCLFHLPVQKIFLPRSNFDKDDEVEN